MTVGPIDIDSTIDAWVASRSKPRFKPIRSADWMEEFERALPQRLPPSFRSLFARYRFPKFTCGETDVYGNFGTGDYDDVVVAAVRDRILASVTRRNGYLQIGRPDTGSYDLICLELRNRTKDGECTVVHLDHEAILIDSKIHVVRTVAPSFLELLGHPEPPN